jgi:hypothetical protein
MNRVTTKITQEISVLFEDYHIDAGTREQVTQHHAGWSASGDAAARRNCFRGHFQRQSLCGSLLLRHLYST